MSPDEKNIINKRGMSIKNLSSTEKASESRVLPKIPEKAELTKSSASRSPPRPTTNPFPGYLTLGGIPLDLRATRGKRIQR
ncbi:MAG: hypothetical protein ACTSP4_08570 [Candidatus Hodarchaeales archaeon]